MLSYHSLALNELSKVKFDTTNIFLADGFLKVDCILQKTKSTNQWDIGNLMLCCHGLTLNEQTEVKSETTKSSVAY